MCTRGEWVYVTVRFSVNVADPGWMNRLGDRKASRAGRGNAKNQDARGDVAMTTVRMRVVLFALHLLSGSCFAQTLSPPNLQDPYEAHPFTPHGARAWNSVQRHALEEP